MSEIIPKKKPKHGKVGRGQQSLLPDEMGYDICMLDDPRHERFCREYAIHKNGTKAYLAAFPGVQPSTARANSSDLLTNTDIVTRIRMIRRERMDKLEVTHEKILQELAKMAFLDPAAFYRDDGSMLPISKIDPDALATIEGLKFKTVEQETDDGGLTRTVVVTEIKHGNKRQALELLMRHREMITDKLSADLTHNGAVGVTDDAAKLEQLRAKFQGGMSGTARTPA
jgi:phage terminase small subunit